MGKMLMAKCKTLQEENEEIGNQASEGKVFCLYLSCPSIPSVDQTDVGSWLADRPFLQEPQPQVPCLLKWVLGRECGLILLLVGRIPELTSQHKSARLSVDAFYIAPEEEISSVWAIFYIASARNSLGIVLLCMWYIWFRHTHWTHCNNYTSCACLLKSINWQTDLFQNWNILYLFNDRCMSWLWNLLCKSLGMRNSGINLMVGISAERYFLGDLQNIHVFHRLNIKNL